MEESESEWAIQEYHSSSKPGYGSSSSMVKWMLNKGFMIGKKMVITGIAISSAPLVVPPLVVFSAMGVAFSLPIGLCFASYAFTNKLMSTILPTPSSPPPLMLEYYYTDPDDQYEQDKDEAFELDDGGCSDDYDHINLVETEDGYNQLNGDDNVNVDHEDSYTYENVLENDENEGHLIQKENVIGVGVDGKGYEEDVGEYLEGDDDSLEEPLIIDVNQSNIIDVFEDEKEEIVKGSTGLLEKIRDEGRVDNVVEDDHLLSEKASNSDDDDDEVKDFKAKEPVMVKEISSQKLLDESKNIETVGEMRHIVILSGGNEENNFNSRELEEIDMVASEVVGDSNREARDTESDEKVMRESMGTQSNDGSEDAILRPKKEVVIHLDSNSREIGDESGLDLVDKEDTKIDLKNLEACDEAKEDTADKNVPFTRAPLATDDAKVASKTKTNKKTPSKEDVLDDEKIWEKIGAMRKIVGYNAPSQGTCIEELKALYVFTGVEPPAGSFKGDSNMDEVNAKLKFLMAIVGVK